MKRHVTTRRHFLRATGTVVALLAQQHSVLNAMRKRLRPSLHQLMICVLAFAVCLTAGAADSPSKPNILWIIAEDACRDFGCFGLDAARTPNIDHLASESCLYRNAFATGPVCSASRSAFMTGLYQTRIGAHNHRSHRTKEFTRPAGIQIPGKITP